jgi:hypothetical protein
MDYFAGLDISMNETHVCVLDREGVVVCESKTESTAQAIAGELSKAPSCRRIVFETGRMAPILFHGLNQLGLPVVCVEMGHRTPDWSFDQLAELERPVACGHHCADGNPQHAAAFRVGISLDETPQYHRALRL